MNECEVRSSAPLRGGGILSQYVREHVRTTVREQLREMLKAGFSTIRTSITHRRSRYNDLEGPLLSEDGSISMTDRQAIGHFIDDIHGAGFHAVEIVFGFLEESNIYCRRAAYGDCFDSRVADVNWRFIRQATEAVMSEAGDLGVRFDLNNEGCPSPSMEPSAVAAAARYLQTIASNFQQEFGTNWLISCPDSPHAQRLILLLTELQEVGLRPRYVEIHTYDTDQASVTNLLDAADSAAKTARASLIIGETRYHSVEQAVIFQRWLRMHASNSVVEIDEWPLRDPATRCSVDTIPPYTPGPLTNLNDR